MSDARRRSQQTTYYDILGVSVDCGPDELRAAYRRLAWAAHPDVSTLPGTVKGERPRPGASMADINEAWRILSDPERRRRYDADIQALAGPRSAPFPNTSPGGPAPPAGFGPSAGSGGPGPDGGQQRAARRRQAWVAGIQAQMARLAGQAGRSATQTLLVKNPRGTRAEYDRVVDELVLRLTADPQWRVRAARAAGAAPLDLGVAATLVGIRSVADQVRRKGSIHVSKELLMEAELLDRMWDVMAHELPAPLTVALGGNPRTAHALKPPR